MPSPSGSCTSSQDLRAWRCLSVRSRRETWSLPNLNPPQRRPLNASLISSLWKILVFASAASLMWCRGQNLRCRSAGWNAFVAGGLRWHSQSGHGRSGCCTMGLVCVELVVGERGRREVRVEKKLGAMWVGWMWESGYAKMVTRGVLEG